MPAERARLRVAYFSSGGGIKLHVYKEKKKRKIKYCRKKISKRKIGVGYIALYSY